MGDFVDFEVVEEEEAAAGDAAPAYSHRDPEGAWIPYQS